MKRFVFVIIILCFTSGLFAQKDTSFYRHELKASSGLNLLSPLWLQEDYTLFNFSVSYSYRPVKWLWIGGNFNNYFGGTIHYNWREYDVNGNFKDFFKSKVKYCFVIAPEIRFSYLNRKSIILYSALSGGVGWEGGYNGKYQKYPQTFPYFHITLFGISGNFGDNNNIFFGGEFGIGMKGLLQIHGGYRF
jgi:hypothetical protein